MELYRFIVATENGEIPIVAAAESEEQAFRIADREIQHDLLKKPAIADLALVEKKIIGKNGAGYLIQPRKSYE
jgi:hypothetical protein